MMEFLTKRFATEQGFLWKRLGLGVAFSLAAAGYAHAAPDGLSAPGKGACNGAAAGSGATPVPCVNPLLPIMAATTPASTAPATPATPETASPLGVPSSTPSAVSPSPSRGAPTQVSVPDYRWKGLTFNVPGPQGTIDPTGFGLRPVLADYGIGWQGYQGDTFFSNLLHSEHNTGRTQQYNGQQPTILSNNFLATIFDFTRHGIPDGQVVAVINATATSWNPLGPNRINLGNLSYYQTALNKALEFKIGLLVQSSEFAGTYVGGNLAGGVFGPSASLFYESGLSNLSTPTYGADLTAHFGKNFYDKAGIARAIDPDGVLAETKHNVGLDLNWSTPNTGAVVINEVGYLRAAAPGVPQMWLRAGADYSGSHYNNFAAGHRTTGEYLVYVLGDRQLLQLSSQPGESARGLYAGFSVERVPPELNRFAEYYEGRLYGIGLLPHREHDQASLTVVDNVFSSVLVRAASRAHQNFHRDSKTITLSYSANLTRGLYLNAGLGYTNNPTAVNYTSNTGSALNAIAGIAFFY